MKTIEVIPVLRIFDDAKAQEFYVDFLGFDVDWEHRFEEDHPVYMQISLGELHLHLTAHHGDCCPGACLILDVQGVEDYQKALLAKQYGYARPQCERTEWGTIEMSLNDPFGNRLSFSERLSK